MMLGCPLRSGARRDEPGMLTGSERTGWILHMAVIITRVVPPPTNNPTPMGTLPEAVQVQVVRVKVQQGLLGVRRALGLKDRGRGRDDGGLTRRVDGLELKLGPHPQTAVGAGMGDDLHLGVQRGLIIGIEGPGIRATVPGSRAPCEHLGLGCLAQGHLGSALKAR